YFELQVSPTFVGMYSFTPSTISAPVKLPVVGRNKHVGTRVMLCRSGPLGLGSEFPPPVKVKGIIHPRRKSASVICAAALNARCGAEQTQTVERQSSTITIAPIKGEEKSPELDDGGTGFPPRDDGDGGGGGGGGGGGWTGGFFFFGFLAFLGFLKDQESEGPYRDSRRR
ncbi:hypothetical protein RJ641_015954, partial [Dillenia turbinata]